MARRRSIRTRRQYEALPSESRAAYERARSAVGVGKGSELPLRMVLDQILEPWERTSMRTILEYFGDAVELRTRRVWDAERERYRTVRGYYVVAGDRNITVMTALTTVGLRDVYVTGSENRRIVREHRHAVKLAARGEPAPLQRWAGRYGSRLYPSAELGEHGIHHALETDPGVILVRAIQREVEYEPYPQA